MRLSHKNGLLNGKRIAILTHGVPPVAIGGVEENVRQHAIRFMELGAHVHIIGSTGGGSICPRIRTTIRPEYENISIKHAGIIKKIRYYRDTTSEAIIPNEFVSLINKAQRMLQQDLSDAEYVIIHNVHSIPLEGYLAYSIALIQEIKRLAKIPNTFFKRAVFIGHDMPCAERPDLIRMLGIKSLDVSERRKVKTLFRPFLNPIYGDKYGFGSISPSQLYNTAKLYMIPPNEVHKHLSYIPTTGIDPETLRGFQGNQNPVGLSPRVESVIKHKRIHEADGILFYPTRIGVLRKRIDLAIKVLAEIHRLAQKEAYPFKRIHLIITGPLDPHLYSSAAAEQLDELITRFGLSEHVSIMSKYLSPPLTFEEVAGLYRFSGGLYIRQNKQDDHSSEISSSLPGFVFSTSSQEGGGMPQVEGIALGIEVITTDLPSIRKNLQGIHNVTYFGVDTSITDIARIVLSRFEERFKSPKQELPAISHEQLSAIEIVNSRFNWNRIVKDLLVPWMLGNCKVLNFNDWK